MLPVYELLPCSYPAPCRSRSSDAPQTCPTPQKTQGPAEASLAPWLLAYPATHNTNITYSIMRQYKSAANFVHHLETLLQY